MKPKQAYAELVRLSREETLLASCADVLEWDQEVSMPRKGVKHRAEQMVLLAGLSHDRATNPRYDELLSVLEQSAMVSDPDSAEAVNVRELRRGYDRERRIPRRLVEEMARVTSLASKVWADAKKRDDFKSFAPWLDRIFALAREEADAAGHDGTRYDALLEDYEPGMTTEKLSQLLERLGKDLVPMIETFRDTPVRKLTGKFPVDLQRGFAQHVAAAVGFDLNGGSLDIGQHPFCTAIGPGDVRIALRFSANNVASGILTLLHEVGHGLYDQGLDSKHFGMPMGEAASLGLHESQSRLWENFVGRSEGFWRCFYPRLSKTFPDALGKISLEDFRAAINRVEPGLIRAEADELTYNLHIVIRFELERSLLSGDLVAADLPGAWGQLYEKYLGVSPKDDRTGCLQDVHWAEGLIGYFPTYSLGNVYAAQLHAAAERDVGPLEETFARGDFRGLHGWLRENVHRHGMRYRAGAIVERATGRPPDPSALIESLSRRYRSNLSVGGGTEASAE
jgi:carboxypeptidase Taq